MDSEVIYNPKKITDSLTHSVNNIGLKEMLAHLQSGWGAPEKLGWGGTSKNCIGSCRSQKDNSLVNVEMKEEVTWSEGGVKASSKSFEV